MANYTLWYMGQGSTEASKSKTFARFYIRPENFYSEVEANILPYSIIDKVVVTIEIKRNGSSLSLYDCDMWWHAYNTENIVVYDSEKLTDVITTSFKSFNHDYTRFFQSGTAQAGKLKAEYGRLAYSGSGSLSRVYTVQKRRIDYTYTPPTFVINTTVQGEGSVSGAGTYDIGSTATLTATPSAGYRFVRWDDGSTSATRTVTVTKDDITANVTTRSYTAIFELDKVNNIYVGSSKVDLIYSGSSGTAVYCGATKIYE